MKNAAKTGSTGTGKGGVTPPVEHQFKPGNPGGSAPRGKRVSTWMAEYGEKDPAEWPNEKNPKLKLSANARIALARLRSALKSDVLALRNSEYVEPRPRQVDIEAGETLAELLTRANERDRA